MFINENAKLSIINVKYNVYFLFSPSYSIIIKVSSYRKNGSHVFPWQKCQNY